MQHLQQLSPFALQYQGRSYPLNKPRMMIGSDQSCDICIESHPSILPMHARISSQDGRVFLQFAQREARIWVNHLLVAQKEIYDQDEIALGDPQILLKLVLNAQAQPANLSPTPGIQTPLPVNGPGANSGALSEPRPTYMTSALPQPVPGMGTPTATLAGSAAFSQPQVSASQKASETTRYLCAAGHLDEDFQNYVMRDVVYEKHRALGESYGVDMSAVVSWTKSGFRRIRVRDWILTILLAMVVFGYFVLPALLFAVASAFLAGSLSTSAYPSDSSSGVPSNPGWGALIIFLILSFLIVSITTAISLFISFSIQKWIKRRWPKSHPGILSYLFLGLPLWVSTAIISTILASFFPFAGAFVAVTNLIVEWAFPLFWLTIFIELIIRYYGPATKRLHKHVFHPQNLPVPLDQELKQKIENNFSTRQRNVVVYSGYRPFAGAGTYKRDWSWSFTVDTDKGMHDTSQLASAQPVRKTPVPFAISNLYDMVVHDVQQLGVGDVLEVEGKLYVRGQYLPEYPAFYDANNLRPVSNVDAQQLAYYKEHPSEDIRYYQCLRFNFWRGEMILTAFLRFVQRQKNLFVEIDYMLLPPVNPDYYWVDTRGLTPMPLKIWQLFLRSFDNPVGIWLFAPLRLMRGFFYTLRQNRFASMARNSLAFDYGADTSVRQEASDDVYHLFFQRLDEEMYIKIIEKRILETTIAFLEAHQIDTTELRQRQEVILNNHTTNNTTNVSGPINNSGAMGIGSGVQVTTGAAPA